VLMTALTIAAGLPSGKLIADEAAPVVSMDTNGRSDVDPERDIYYLVFDRYAGEQSLREFLQLDNSEFSKDLERRGFVVGNGSRGNYPNTSMSLASSLNMSYLDWLGDADSLAPVNEAIRDNGVGRVLKEKGYRFIQIGSWWDATKVSDVADVNYRMDPLSEYTRALYGSTAVSVAVRQGWLGKAELPIRHRDIAIKQFSALVRLAQMPELKFVFAHILLPHPPYVFDRDGGWVKEKPGSDEERSRAYVEQLRFTNRKIIEVVDTLLKAHERKPVIIIQSDEGPHPGYGGIAPADWTKASRRELLLKFRILNAYHLPGVAPSMVYPTISPVNTFRLVFNEYFGAQLPLLPDESFVSSRQTPFNFVSVTDQVRD
ncbi:MAG: sulfatase-like hydrolase/transferase, partial [bacterium]